MSVISNVPDITWYDGKVAIQSGMVRSISAALCANHFWQQQWKVKVGFLYSATYTKPEQRALQSREWQLIGKSQWCCSANATIRCPALTDIGPAVAASKGVQTLRTTLLFPGFKRYVP